MEDSRSLGPAQSLGWAGFWPESETLVPSSVLRLVRSPGAIVGGTGKECRPGGWVSKSNVAVEGSEQATLSRACLLPGQPHFLGAQQASSDFYEEAYSLEPKKGSSFRLLVFPPSLPSVAS